MKSNDKKLFNIIKWIAAIYTIAYLFFPFPKDNELIRIMTVIFTTIFSITILLYVLKLIDKKVNHIN